MVFWYRKGRYVRPMLHKGHYDRSQGHKLPHFEKV